MLRLALALGLAMGSPAQADGLLQQYEAASVALEKEIFRSAGHTPEASLAYATWTPQRRADSGCALHELERMRGRRVAEQYVQEYAQAARRAPGSNSIMGLIAQVHGRVGIGSDLLIFIAQKCGIGL